MTVERHLGARPCHVYDYDGEYLGSFTSWSVAHEWAHLQAALGGVPGPLEVEDRRAAHRRRVWADRCEVVVSVAHSPAAGAAESTAPVLAPASAPDGVPVGIGPQAAAAVQSAAAQGAPAHRRSPAPGAAPAAPPGGGTESQADRAVAGLDLSVPCNVLDAPTFDPPRPRRPS